MMPGSDVQELDPIYFDGKPWSERLNDWLKEHAPDPEKFYLANKQAIESSILSGDTALNMAVNIPAHALLGFLMVGKYQNTYQRKSHIGGAVRVNPRRERVDKALFGDKANQYYFGALALGGTGVRFYGEYCMILRRGAVDRDTRIMDRNSWDIDFPPLSNYDTSEVVERLKGEWERDAVAMATLKVLPQIRERVRLTTTGRVSEAVLHDESFIEVHKQGTFAPDDLHEVRESPVDAAIESQIVHRCENGHPPTPEEALWVMRRGHVTRSLADHRVRSRFVASSGRERS